MMRYYEVTKIKNTKLFSEVIFNNFIYLNKFPDLGHTKENIVKILNNENSVFFLAYDKNKLIGYLVGDIRTFGDGRYGIYISYLYVMQKYRKQGIGSKLMSDIIYKAKKQGIKFLLLRCDTDDHKVVNFYKKYGFVVDPALKNKGRHEVFCLYL